ncbi:XRE family transcriptional regulator [Mesorhizobium sp. M2D.F.Ca.ET.145.01.1.1]|uniref:helix-turn-helix domain-containing protein n=1 Tax=unclassified Mesorhizobium TaxID=325217 RepID=UPI000FCBBBF4|nr:MULTISPECIES: helix-turn-helix transcriptional regulator [unclassified Mesorhizobium]TGU44616.1 XRE family transcriptional regulator [bacterium M00.F.Ca.ET.146.01.1.1]TGU58444.1 XRE family transcriptional regulator [Mesorhizobium sp. M2D.F.Ca.ET.148.01.1.1]TGU64376.1 XRE family transcriptional regulator [Mesorhizobium sp. M2D.F.Ca.ET.147.01.1.1]TGW09952.1 XRE family transcriptional regulator [Mesorhizobium sp. M2D.F.Ca.ET.145.01.1.1]
MANPKLCSIPNCGKRTHARGWCDAHYKRWQTQADPLAGKDGTTHGKPLAFYQEALAYRGDDCLVWPFARDPRSGYGKMKVGGKMCVVSRLICAEVNGQPPTPSHDAAHSCGKGHEGCINQRHLSWKTRAENMADAIRHGTTTRGERSHHAKLTEAEVRQIRNLRGKMLQREIGDLFGVTQQTIGDIMTGRRWGWL